MDPKMTVSEGAAFLKLPKGKKYQATRSNIQFKNQYSKSQIQDPHKLANDIFLNLFKKLGEDELLFN